MCVTTLPDRWFITSAEEAAAAATPAETPDTTAGNGDLGLVREALSPDDPIVGFLSSRVPAGFVLSGASRQTTDGGPPFRIVVFTGPNGNEISLSSQQLLRPTARNVPDEYYQQVHSVTEDGIEVLTLSTPMTLRVYAATRSGESYDLVVSSPDIQTALPIDVAEAQGIALEAARSGV